MRHARKVTGAVAVAVAALAMTGGVAGATAHAKGSAPSVSGTVTAVNGDTTPGVCGDPGASGAFTLTTTGATPTAHEVDVTAATSFVQKKVAAPTFANVCVGDDATAIGVQTGYVVVATGVSVHVPKATHKFGTVTDIDGVSTAGTCGTAGASGTFSLSTLVSGATVVTTVFVDHSTKFTVSDVGRSTSPDSASGMRPTSRGSPWGARSWPLRWRSRSRRPRPPSTSRARSRRSTACWTRAPAVWPGTPARS